LYQEHHGTDTLHQKWPSHPDFYGHAVRRRPIGLKEESAAAQLDRLAGSQKRISMPIKREYQRLFKAVTALHAAFQRRYEGQQHYLD
jgi:hypothetical protein